MDSDDPTRGHSGKDSLRANENVFHVGIGQYADADQVAGCANLGRRRHH
jgi:hypothetical protein